MDEKDYGLEYEKEVLAAFDRMKNKYENPDSENKESKPEQPPVGDDTRIFEKPPVQPQDQLSQMAESAASFEAFMEAELAKQSHETPSVSDEFKSLVGESSAPVHETPVVNAAAESVKPQAEAPKEAPTEEPAAPQTQNTTPAEAEAPMGKKQKKKKKKKRSFWRILWKVILWLILIFGCAVVAAGIVVGSKVMDIIKDTPEINPDNIYELLGEHSVILDKDGNFLENIYSGDALRTNIEYNELPKNLVNAFVSIEDKTFFEHHGFNYIRLAGAVVDKLTGKSERIGGTSTITQQLARNLYLSDVKSERSTERKIREAYYTVVLENSLSKEQILEAYLNTIYLGYNSNGVAAAAEAYFNKDVQDLNILECATLASLPQSPNKYAPMKRVSVASVSDPDSLDIISKDDEWIIYFNGAAKDRTNLVLRFMHEQGRITDAEYNAAKADSIRNYINPGTSATSYSKYSYFVDYVKDQVLKDLQNFMGYSSEEASKLLYSGGLTIHSTLDTQIQDILEGVYSNPDNFPDVGTLRLDKQKNLLYHTGDKILLYAKENMFNADGNFVLKPDEFTWKDNGDLVIYKGHRLNIYNTTVGDHTDYSIEFKGFYEIEDKRFYSYSGGAISVPAAYKTRDEDGNVVISKDFFASNSNGFVKSTDGTITIDSNHFSLTKRVLQPQSAMTIMDYTTSQLVAMIGGRGIEGKLLYNRATSTRQPGSSIKPIAVYSTALQAGVDGLGPFTAAMPIDDAPIKLGNSYWPKNWYKGYTGMTNMRHAVEQSINACAVQLYMQLDPMMCIRQLQNMGVTSLVTSGGVNDVNASALALGGMSRGISPLEMTGAYGTFGNYGTYTEPCCYTQITNRRGDVVIDKKPITNKVLDEATASLMTDILRTTVTNGLAKDAKLKASESAGKTGTTSEKYDIWFCGLTPRYSAAVWIGNDVNIPLKQGSSSAVKVWKMVMDDVQSLYSEGYDKFEMKGEFVKLTVDRHSGKLPGPFTSGTITELFIAGTEPTEVDDSHKVVNVCAETGYLATPYCSSVIQKVATVRPGGSSWESIVGSSGGSVSALPDAKYDVPEFYCPKHNPDTSSYPVPPSGSQEALYNPNDVVKDPESDPGAVVEPKPEDVIPPTDDPLPEDPNEGLDPIIPNTPEVPIAPENPPVIENPQEPVVLETPVVPEIPQPVIPEDSNTEIDENGEVIHNW